MVKLREDLFINEGQATVISLYLRTKSKKDKRKLFKRLTTPLARKRALEMEKILKDEGREMI